MKRAVILCMIFSILLTGCWDRREMSTIGIVTALGIDKAKETDDIVFTVEVLRPSALKPDAPSGESASETVTTSGATIDEAITRSFQKFDRENVYGHNKLIVVGEELARDGLLPYLDVFQRDRQARGYIWFCIAKGFTAKEAIQTRGKGVESYQANYLKNIIDNQKKYNFSSIATSFRDFYKNIIIQGMEPVAGVFQLVEKEHQQVGKEGKNASLRYAGVAAFDHGKLVGFLSEEETRGYNRINENVEGGTLIIPFPSSKEHLLSLDVQDSHAQIHPHIKGDDISFTIDIKEGLNVSEIQTTGVITTEEERKNFLTKIENEAKKKIITEVEAALQKGQKELKTDIFGFGRQLKKEDPQKWKEVKDQWPDLFPEVNVDVKPDVTIHGYEFIRGTIEPKR